MLNTQKIQFHPSTRFCDRDRTSRHQHALDVKQLFQRFALCSAIIVAASARIRSLQRSPATMQLKKFAAKSVEILEAATLHDCAGCFNLTGTVLHTNLVGRSSLRKRSLAACTAERAPTKLEFDLENGARGIVELVPCDGSGSDEEVWRLPICRSKLSKKRGPGNKAAKLTYVARRHQQPPSSRLAPMRTAIPAPP